MALSIIPPINKLLHTLVNSLLLLTILLLYVPVNPNMPGIELDEAWKFGINQAQSMHLVFGKDIIFTFGPYSSILTKLYHPYTDHLIVFAGLTLGIFSAFVVFYLTRYASILWKFFFTCFLVAGIYSPDVNMFLYPLLVAMYVYQVTLDKVNLSNRIMIFCGSLFFPFGVLFLIKGSLMILLVGTTGLCAALFWCRNIKPLAIAVCLVPLAALVFFQVMAGQPVSGLWYYVTKMFSISSGYTEAMSLQGKTKETLVYIVVAIAILLFCYRIKNIPATSRWFLVLFISLFLFITFKAGFTRHDGHALIAASTLFAVGFLLFIVLQHKKLYVLFTIIAVTWFYILYNYIGLAMLDMIKPIPPIYTSAYEGLKFRLSGKLQDRYKKSLDLIKNSQIMIPALKGTSDIYSYEQSYLLVSGNSWSPRPVLQSYSAYNSQLAEINEAHLTGSTAPDNIIFKVQTIDNRLPALDDGLSWPTIINNYQPSHADTAYLYLKQKRALHISPSKEKLYTIQSKIGQEVIIPDTSEMLFARVDIKPTFIGSASSIFFQPNPLKITLILGNDSSVQCRFIPNMAKSGFILSPFINNTEDFALLFGNTASLKNKMVKSFIISNDGRGKFDSWKTNYKVELSKINYDK